MVHVMVMGHGGLPAGIESASAMILGAQENFHIVSLLPEDTPEAFTERVEGVLGTIGPDEEVLFLVDVKGGTPSNVAARFVNSRRRCVTGANLPMVLDVLLNRSSGATVSELVKGCVDAGSAGVLDFSAEIDEMRSKMG